MMGEVNDLLYFKLDVVIVLQNVNLLLVIHDEQALLPLFLHVIGCEFTIVFKGYKPAASQLPNLLFSDLIGL